MYSKIAKKLKLKYSPIAVLSTDYKPESAIEFVEGRWCCISSVLTAVAKGLQAVFGRSTYGCDGGGMGLGFKNNYPEYSVEFMSEEQGVKKTPALAKDYLESVSRDVITPDEYVVFKPLAEVDTIQEKPKVVVFLANPDQLAALVNLANYARPGIDNVIIHNGGGCHTYCRFPWAEASKESPKAVVGMMDLTARAFIDANLLTFSMPYDMFVEMESNVEGSFFDKSNWNKLAERN